MKGKATDVVIFVIGPGASGKSTFIHNILKGDKSYTGPFPAVSDSDMECVTRAITPYVARLPPAFNSTTAERLVLVDTPGSNDDPRGVEETLGQIGTWFKSTYKSKVEVAGVVYLYTVWPERMTDREQANLRAFAWLCGKKSLQRVWMATTRWNLCTEEKGAEREEQLRTKYWRPMIEAGSNFTRLHDDHQSAKSLLEDVLKTARDLTLQLPSRKESALLRKRKLKEELKNTPKTDRDGRRRIEAELREHKASHAALLEKSFFGRVFAFLN